MTQIGTVIEGKYEVLKEIGRGGMSIVYLAMDKRLNKQWAVKEIRKKGNGKNDEIVVNSLIAEANMMKRLDHPSLPRIVDIIDNGVTIYVVMDYIEGESLDKILNEYGAQPEEKVIAWAKQLCDALGYLHAQKPPIIYRDMKPANVMLKPEGNIKIIDFGIAREYKEQNLADTTVLGTKGYAPPEQYSGQTDPRSDIYALGMTMHHLLTGVDPRGGEAYASVRQWNPTLSEGVEAIIDKCVQPAAENRYQNCTDLLYDLEHPELITKGFKKKQKRKLRLFVASALMSILLLISAVLCKNYATQIQNNNYERLIDPRASSTYEEMVEEYKDAIAIYPGDTRAYMCLLEAYENAGKFGVAENQEFSHLYKTHLKDFDVSEAEFAELNYKIGTMYFNYYTGDGDSFATRINKANGYFTENYENYKDGTLKEDYEHRASSDRYYQICSFYKKYILNQSSPEDASKDDYNSLLDTVEAALNDAGTAGQYEQLALYNATMMLIYDQREEMAAVQVDQQRLQDILKLVRDSAKRLSVTKEQATTLRQEVLSNYETYTDAVATAYNNARREDHDE